MPDCCQSCKAPVHWAITSSGAKAPIDYEPTEKGNVLLLRPRAFGAVPDNALGDLLAVTLSGDALAIARRHTPGQLFLNHWATCPDKAEWREKQTRKAAKSGAASG